VVVVGGILPFSPVADLLGFQALPVGFFAALALMVVGYLALIEVAKRVFFGNPAGRLPLPRRRNRSRGHQVQRRVSRFSYHGPARHRGVRA
jgi:Mg2+-importing ATPase